MSIVSLFCEIDDFFLEYEKCESAHCLPGDVSGRNPRASAKPASERGDDDPHRLPSKQLSDV